MARGDDCFHANPRSLFKYAGWQIKDVSDCDVLSNELSTEDKENRVAENNDTYFNQKVKPDLEAFIKEGIVPNQQYHMDVTEFQIAELIKKSKKICTFF